MPAITPFIWFDNQAEEAARFYTSLFPNSRIDNVFRSTADTPSGAKDTVLTVDYTLDGRRFTALNGGPQFPLSEAVSFAIDCADQAEVDRYWDALLADGGEPSQCGWLKDRFGLSWQVIPRQLNEYINGPDREAAGRAMQAMLKMVKLDVEKLREAYEGVGV